MDMHIEEFIFVLSIYKVSARTIQRTMVRTRIYPTPLYASTLLESLIVFVCRRSIVRTSHCVVEYYGGEPHSLVPRAMKPKKIIFRVCRNRKNNVTGGGDSRGGGGGPQGALLRRLQRRRGQHRRAAGGGSACARARPARARRAPRPPAARGSRTFPRGCGAHQYCSITAYLFYRTFNKYPQQISMFFYLRVPSSRGLVWTTFCCRCTPVLDVLFPVLGYRFWGLCCKLATQASSARYLRGK